MKKFFKKINLTPKQALYILLIALAIVFTAQNAEGVRVRFLFFGFELPQVVIIITSFFIGFFTAKIFSKKKNVRTNEIEYSE